jgi:hypothetical protein
MSTNNSNGQGNRLLWWITGSILGPIVLAVFTHSAATLGSSAQRVSRLEAAQDEFQRRLERIEQKLDRLLERR